MLNSESRDSFGRSELHYAALRDDAVKVRDLIVRGFDPNLGDREGFTPLHLAAQEFALMAARELLSSGADVRRDNQYGNAPLWTAVFNSKGRGEMIHLLLESGADRSQLNHSGQTPEGLARLIGNYDVSQHFEQFDRDQE